MPATMRILGWKSEGLRCPDHEMSFVDGNGQLNKISLIQMPNGTGKTTTLGLLRAALSGAAISEKWDSKKVREFQKKGSQNVRGRFEVKLSLNDRLVTIIMNFNFESEVVTYKTTRGNGQVDGFDPPLEFRRFLNDKFVNFFIFDGELAQHLLDRQHTHAETVVDRLFQIDVLPLLAAKVKEYWDYQSQNDTATEERGLARRTNRLESLRKRLTLLQHEKGLLEKKKQEFTAKLKAKETAYEHELKKEKDRSRKLVELETNVAKLESSVRASSQKVLDMMVNPHALSPTFAHDILDLKTGLDRVKLPESAAREFFEELADESECVCGRYIDDEIRTVIRHRASQYLGSDDVSLLNSMKTSIDEAVGLSCTEPARDLDLLIDQLENLVDQEVVARNELEFVKFDAENTDPAIKSVRDEINDLKLIISNIDNDLLKFNSEEDDHSIDHTFGIDVIKKMIEDAETKLAQICKTMILKAKRDILADILSVAHRNARTGVTTEICRNANLKILELMPDNNISIEKIDHCLILKDQAGGSAGEQLSIAYAFLATLFNRSDHTLPFVVDSPAGPIDLAVRPKIGELVPKLSEQFIAFTISSERVGFLPRLKKFCNEQIQYITLFRKNSSSAEQIDTRYNTLKESSDGLLVTGENFFNDFQLDSEEA